MKNLVLIFALIVSCTVTFAQDQVAFYPKPQAGTSPFSSPELMKGYLQQKGLKIIDAGEGSVGYGKDLHGGEVDKAVLIKEVTLPRDTYQFEIFTFICNNGEGCLGPTGSWVRGEYKYFQDLTYCQINQPHVIPNADGSTTVKGYFLNWSDCDKRRGKMFVAYKTKQMALDELKKELGEI